MLPNTHRRRDSQTETHIYTQTDTHAQRKTDTQTDTKPLNKMEQKLHICKKENFTY